MANEIKEMANYLASIFLTGDDISDSIRGQLSAEGWPDDEINDCMSEVAAIGRRLGKRSGNSSFKETPEASYRVG